MSRYLSWVLLFVTIMGGASGALACSCVPTPTDLSTGAADAEIRGIDLLAEAKVTGFRSREQCYPDKDGTPLCVVEDIAEFSVITPYKGTVGKTVEIQLGSVTSTCGPHFEEGQKLLLAATFIAEPQRDDSIVTPAGYETSDCALYRSVPAPIQGALDRYRRGWQEMEAKVSQTSADAADWRSLGKFLEEWRDYPHALDVYERASARYPDDPDFQAARGRLLFTLHRPEAWEPLQRAVVLRPQDAKSQSLLHLLGRSTDGLPDNRHLDLGGLDLGYKSFVGLILTGSSFRGANLGGARFVDTRLTAVDFRDTNLSGAVMKNVVLRNADFTGSDIGGLQLDATNLSGAKFADVYVNLAYFSNPKTPDGSILSADLTKAKIDCDNYEADLARQIATQQPAAILTERCRASAGLK